MVMRLEGTWCRPHSEWQSRPRDPGPPVSGLMHFTLLPLCSRVSYNYADGRGRCGEGSVAAVEEESDLLICWSAPVLSRCLLLWPPVSGLLAHC